MIKNTVEKIEASIQKIGSLDHKSKAELIQLLSALKSEVAELSKSHGAQAESIAGFTEIASHEATRADKQSNLQDLSLEGLATSVKGFEASHPKLVETVNELCNLLASIGI